jgi:hypothetical protein
VIAKAAFGEQYLFLCFETMVLQNNNHCRTGCNSASGQTEGYVIISGAGILYKVSSDSTSIWFERCSSALHSICHKPLFKAPHIFWKAHRITVRRH